MAINTQLLTNLKGAIFLLHFNPVRIECLSDNQWGKQFLHLDSKDPPLDGVVRAIELAANIEEQSDKILKFLSANPTDNYNGSFSYLYKKSSTQYAIFNASIAKRNIENEVVSALCVVLDMPKILQTSSQSPTTFSNENISLNKFSRREQEVINELVNGLTSKEIAKKLFISENTVETHRGRIFKKAGVKNVASLVGRVNGSKVFI